MRKYQECLFILVFVMCMTNLLAQPAGLDNTFDTDGKKCLTIENTDDVRFIKVDANGKILIGGASQELYNDFSVIRLNSDGTVDMTFGDVHGFFEEFQAAIISLSSSTDVANDVAFDADDKIVLAGYAYASSTTQHDVGVARLNTDGSPDNTFSSDGKVIHSFAAEDDHVNAVAIDENGKILMAGYYTTDDLDFRYLIVRLNADGTLDNTLSGSGYRQLTIFDGYAHSVLADAGGKFWISGGANVWNGSGTTPSTVILKFNSDGSFDNSFNGNGQLTIFQQNSSGIRYGLKILKDANGKILVGGSDIIRVNTDGTMDNSFSSDGIVYIPDFSMRGSSMTIDAQGRILAVGTDESSSDRIKIVRLNSDGSFDNSFDGDGILSLSLGSVEDFARAVTLDGNQKILVLGETLTDNHVNYAEDFCVLRLNGGGAVTSLMEASSANLKIYPNPSANGRFSIESEEKIKEITLVNALGQKEVFYSSDIQTSLNGLLVAIIETESGMYSSKIQVE